MAFGVTSAVAGVRISSEKSCLLAGVGVPGEKRRREVGHTGTHGAGEGGVVEFQGVDFEDGEEELRGGLG